MLLSKKIKRIILLLVNMVRQNNKKKILMSNINTNSNINPSNINPKINIIKHDKQYDDKENDDDGKQIIILHNENSLSKQKEKQTEIVEISSSSFKKLTIATSKILNMNEWKFKVDEQLESRIKLANICYQILQKNEEAKAYLDHRINLLQKHLVEYKRKRNCIDEETEWIKVKLRRNTNIIKLLKEDANEILL